MRTRLFQISQRRRYVRSAWRRLIAHTRTSCGTCRRTDERKEGLAKLHRPAWGYLSDKCEVKFAQDNRLRWEKYQEEREREIVANRRLWWANLSDVRKRWNHRLWWANLADDIKEEVAAPEQNHSKYKAPAQLSCTALLDTNDDATSSICKDREWARLPREKKRDICEKRTDAKKRRQKRSESSSTRKESEPCSRRGRTRSICRTISIGRKRSIGKRSRPPRLVSRSLLMTQRPGALLLHRTIR